VGEVTITITIGDSEEARERERQRELMRKRGPTKGRKYQGTIKGLSHNRNRLELWRKVKVGDKCELVLEPENPEPENPMDRNAILIQWRGRTLGHLNASKAKLISPYIEGGALFAVTIVYSQPGVIWRNGKEDYNWHDISVIMAAIAPNSQSLETKRKPDSLKGELRIEPAVVTPAESTPSQLETEKRPWWNRFLGLSLAPLKMRS